MCPVRAVKKKYRYFVAGRQIIRIEEWITEDTVLLRTAILKAE